MPQAPHIQQFIARYRWVLIFVNTAMLFYLMYCMFSNYQHNNQTYDIVGIVVILFPSVNAMVMVYGLVSSLTAVMKYPDARFLRYLLIAIALPVAAWLSSVVVIALLQNLFSLICK